MLPKQTWHMMSTLACPDYPEMWKSIRDSFCFALSVPTNKSSIEFPWLNLKCLTLRETEFWPTCFSHFGLYTCMKIELQMLLFPNALCCSLYERNCVCAVTKIFTKFLPANNFCQLLWVTRKRSCTVGMINRGRLELATSPIKGSQLDALCP